MRIMSFATPVLIAMIGLAGCVTGEMAYLEAERAYIETVKRHLEEFQRNHPNEDRFKMSASAREMVGYQLRDNNPPETRQALQQLLAQGIAEDAATDAIAQAFQIELHDMLKLGKLDGRTRYLANLKRLPQEPTR